MFGFGKHALPEEFFRGACDIHCHILPGVDDGFASREASFQALRKLEEYGVEKMILTPHFMKEYPNNNRSSIQALFESFKVEAKKESKIELFLGAEYMLDVRFMDHFKDGFLTLDKTHTHVLCETSYLMNEPGAGKMVYEVMCDGFQPVVAHPERYEYASKEKYVRWKDKRYKFQLNLLSLAGGYGSMAEAKAYYLLNEGYYDYIGSDMHRLDNYRHYFPKIRLKTREIDKLYQLLENNKTLFI